MQTIIAFVSFAKFFYYIIAHRPMKYGLYFIILLLFSRSSIELKKMIEEE